VRGEAAAMVLVSEEEASCSDEVCDCLLGAEGRVCGVKVSGDGERLLYAGGASGVSA